jgi:hypothetical protein
MALAKHSEPEVIAPLYTGVWTVFIIRLTRLKRIVIYVLIGALLLSLLFECKHWSLILIS